ncbi:MAG: recombinase family protein, partial [Pyrinomonadaceae bacterium]
METRAAVKYGRVSSKEQEKEGFSIPAQWKLLDRYAEAERFKIAEEFIDIETAKRPGRPGFDKMVKFLKRSPSVRVLIVEKTDRLYRNLKDYVTMDELDLEIHFVKESVVLSRDSRSSDKFMHGIKVLMAKNYIDNLSEETKKGMLEKAEQAIYPSFAPLGYRNVMGPNGKRIIESDPDVAPIIIQIFEWYATGQCSIAEITQRVRQAGLVSRGARKPISKSNINNVLRKRIYTGDFDWNGKTYRGSHQPLVSMGLFDRVQEILDGRFTTKQKVAKHEFAYSGLVNCGHCGCALVAEKKKGKYVYYHCTGNKGKCDEPYTREETLEKCFADLLKGLVFDDEVMDWVTEALHQSHADEKRFRDEAIARLQAEYVKIQNRLDKLYEDRLDGFVEPAFFERKAQEWRQAQNRLTEQIADHQGANHNYFQDGVRLLELSKKAYFLFEKQNPTERRRLLDFVCSNSTWKDKTLTATFRQPFDLLAVTNTAWQ